MFGRQEGDSGPGTGHRDRRVRDPRTRHRDRHGRGMRGPLAVGGPLAPSGVPVSRSRAQRFDDLVLDAVERLERRFAKDLSGVEFAVEDVPGGLRDDHSDRSSDHHSDHHSDPDGDEVPLGAVLATDAGRPARIVVYRRPIELRAVGSAELSALVHDVVVEQVADLLGLDPDQVDPDYGAG